MSAPSTNVANGTSKASSTGLFTIAAASAIVIHAAREWFRARFFAGKLPWMSKPGYIAGRRWKPKAGDVVIATPPKSGTTWVSQICHQIRMIAAGRANEGMDFDEITEVVPWINVAQDVGQDVDAEQVANPRLYKSHMKPSNTNIPLRRPSKRRLPDGPKLLVTIREPAAVLKSLYAFLKAKRTYQKDLEVVDLNAFVHHRHWKNCLFDYSMSELFYELWAARSSPDLLVVPYERLLSDLDGQIMRITRFFGFDDMTDEQRALVKSRCMRDFMLAHKDHFDDHWIPQQQHKLSRSPHKMHNIVKVRPKNVKAESISLATVGVLRREWEELASKIQGQATRQETYNYNNFVTELMDASPY